MLLGELPKGKNNSNIYAALLTISAALSVNVWHPVNMMAQCVVSVTIVRGRHYGKMREFGNRVLFPSAYSRSLTVDARFALGFIAWGHSEAALGES
jgi:hypothetical protein